MKASQYILVSNPIEVPDKNSWRDSKAKGFAKIPTKILSDNVQGFVTDIAKILDKVDATLSKFEMSEIEVSAAITASGELSLMGIGGGELGIEGGIKFVFKKK